TGSRPRSVVQARRSRTTGTRSPAASGTARGSRDTPVRGEARFELGKGPPTPPTTTSWGYWSQRHTPIGGYSRGYPHELPRLYGVTCREASEVRAGNVCDLGIEIDR